MGCGFTSGWQELGSVFSAVVCKIQTSERYIESLPLVLKDKKGASHKVKGQLYSCLLISCLPSGKTLNWHLETIYMPHYPLYRQMMGIIVVLTEDTAPIVRNLITSEDVSSTVVFSLYCMHTCMLCQIPSNLLLLEDLIIGLACILGQLLMLYLVKSPSSQTMARTGGSGA